MLQRRVLKNQRIEYLMDDFGKLPNPNQCSEPDMVCSIEARRWKWMRQVMWVREDREIKCELEELPRGK